LTKPRIYVWAEKNTDKLRPGFVAHALAADGTVILHRLCHGQTIDWVKKDMTEGVDAVAAYRESYPLGWDLAWVDNPTHDYGLIAARLRADHPYRFTTKPPRSVVMTSERTGKTVGFVISMEPLESFYATKAKKLPTDGSLPSDTKPFNTPADAVQHLHRLTSEE
jgi:hypothetical protein